MTREEKTPEASRIDALNVAKELLSVKGSLGGAAYIPPADLIAVASFIEGFEAGAERLPLIIDPTLIIGGVNRGRAVHSGGPLSHPNFTVNLAAQMPDTTNDAASPLPTKFGACGSAVHRGERRLVLLADPGTHMSWQVFNRPELAWRWASPSALSAFIPGTMDPTGSLA